MRPERPGARLLAAALLLLAAFGAAAQETRRYAALSLVGDKLLIVTKDMSTGSRIDRNYRTYVDLPDAALDNAAVLAIDDALKRSGAPAETVLLSLRDSRFFALQDDILEGRAENAALVAGLRERLGQVKATHLILVTKYRHESMLRMADGNVGAGRLEGLGFYIDTVMRVQNTTTGESATGFLASFAYFRLSLVDLSTWKVVAEEEVLGSTVRSAASSKSGHPWEAMNAATKSRALQAVVRREIAEAVPKLVAK